MERLIVNEGQGPAIRELTSASTRVGAGPDSDVVLRHPSTRGCSFIVERTPFGHRVRVVSGLLLRNEESCTSADLLHNDTLRVGETLVLYKNPAATLPPAEPTTMAPREQLAPPTFEELSVLEELEPLEELQPLDEPVEAEAPMAAAPVPRQAVVPASEPVELLELETLDELEELTELEEHQPVESFEELEPLEALEALEPVAPTTAPAAPAATAPTTESGEAPTPEPEATAARPPTRAAEPAPLRPAHGIRFRRPLPPGRRGPAFLPPAHPGHRSR